MTRKEATKKLLHDAHPLRNVVVGRNDFCDRPSIGCDCYGRPTTGRITYGEAVTKYGEATVQAAIAAGDVYLDEAVAGPDTRLMANGVTIG